MKKSLKSSCKLSLLTGLSAAKIFEEFKKEINVKGLDFNVVDIKNDFFGDKINVTGLVTGQDLVFALKKNQANVAIIPSVMLREGTDEFLDGIKVSQIKKEFPKTKFYIINDCYKFREILEIINSL